MNILMVAIPTAGDEGQVPFGVLYAASSALRCGHNVKILDLVKEDLPYNKIRRIIEDFSTDLIGMGGITSSYNKCKELIRSIKTDFHDMPVVVGGIISSAGDLLLKKAGADYVVHGEAETTFPGLIKEIEQGRDARSVRGISFLKDGVVCKTEDAEQIKDLDEIPIPAYELLDMDKYLNPLDSWIRAYFGYDKAENKMVNNRIGANKFYLPVITARGCTNRCIFCYRHYRGWRQHSAEYVVNMMRALQSRYGVNVFQTCDELTTANREWILRFCEILMRDKHPIFFIIGAARVDSVDEEVLGRLKDAGCLMINYGYESGADAILKEIRKGATRAQALKTAYLTRKAGLKNVPAIIIGFPSETKETVNETIDFLKKIDEWPISVNTPIPFPRTPLWEYALQHEIITDEEKFISGYRPGIFVNFTRLSDAKLLSLVNKAYHDVELNWLKNRKKYVQYAKTSFKIFLMALVNPILRSDLNKWLRARFSKVNR